MRQTTGGSRRYRNALLALYQAGLTAVDGRTVVERALRQRQPGKVWAVAIGKAAAAMAQGALDALGDDLEGLLVITKYGHAEALDAGRFGPGVRVLESGHPLPDEHSLEAGGALLRFLQGAPEQARLLFLVSGGTSALAEVLPEGYGAAKLAELNRLLLASGMAIGQMNAIRKRVSCIKGGRLVSCLAGRRTLQLLVSDVPGDALDVIGSGLLVPDRSSSPDLSALPAWVRQMAASAPAVPGADDPLFRQVESEIVATNRAARAGMAAKAREEGIHVLDHDGLLTEAPEAAAERILAEIDAGPPGLYLWGGETPVTLPPEPGRGGRCQALALEVAGRIQGREDLFVLCGSTDGTDGPTEDAGALVDGGTTMRGEMEGLAWREALVRADSGHFLEACGDLIQTGPTGTNVMDLVLAYKADVG